MTTDLYTKAVLTVIAIALSGIAIQLTIKEAHAQSQSAKFSPSGALMVTICDPTGAFGQRTGWTCADVRTEGLTVIPQQ
jgi:hypothetical protein